MRGLNSGYYEYGFAGLENFPLDNCMEEGRKSRCTSALWLGFCKSMLSPAKDMFLELVTSEGFMIFTCKGQAENTRRVTKENFHNNKGSRTKEIWRRTDLIYIYKQE